MRPGSAQAVCGAVGELIFHNRYSYANNNPVNLTDPSGLAFWLGRGEGIENLFLAGGISNSNVHAVIQSLAMEGQRDIVHAEYPIPIGVFRQGNYPSEVIQNALRVLTAQQLSYIDLLNERTGEMWEIKPVEDEASGVATNRAQLALMTAAQAEGHLLGNDHPITGDYDWSYAPIWNTGRSFSMIPVFLGTDISGWVRFYARQSQRGVIIWWKEQNAQPDPVPVPILLPENVTWSRRNRVPRPVFAFGDSSLLAPESASIQLELAPLCLDNLVIPTLLTVGG